MRFQAALISMTLVVNGGVALAYVPAKTPTGADRHWASSTLTVHLTGPTTVDNHAVHDAARRAMSTWNAIAHARINLTAPAGVDDPEPTIGNGKNEFGWVERSDSPYFIPGVPCTTVSIYDTASGVISEADTTCNAMAYQWPPNLFGLFTQNGVADAESAALSAFGSWLGLDASLVYGDPMYPAAGSGYVVRTLASDQFAFGRHVYGDGTSQNGAIRGTARFTNGAPIPFAYVTALSTTGVNVYGAVADAYGEYTIFEPVAGTYYVAMRPLTTDPYILSSVPYRANSISNLDFSPTYFRGGLQVQVENGVTIQPVDLTASRIGSQPDAYEPNDSAGDATALAVGFSKLATTHAPLDTDWYWFQTAPDNCYLIGTSFLGASIVPAHSVDAFWSTTRLAAYVGTALAGWSESKDPFELDPGSWITYCEAAAGRRVDVAVEQREAVGGAGYFYSISVQSISNGSAVTPTIGAVYPDSGWSNRSRYAWIDGSGFMPGAKVELRLPDATWVTAADVITTGCGAVGQCTVLKALFPSATPGVADVKVTNPNGRSATKTAAFRYLPVASGPFYDRTPQVFGERFGEGKAVCIGDYDGDGNDDIFKSRYASLPYQLFKSDGGASFSDVAAWAGLDLDPPLYGESCSFVDVDDDGDLDVYATNLAAFLPDGSSSELYVNRLAETGDATFARSTPFGLGGQADRYQRDAAWADFDRDGRIDVVLAYDSYAAGAPYEDAVRYFRQGANGTFTDVTGLSGLAGYVAAITSVKAADFNGDDCDDLAFFTHAGTANRLYVGNCGGHFTNVTSQSHVADGAPWCTGVAVADFNDDGRIDILCGSYNTGSPPVRPRLWLNNGNASFTDRASESGLYAVARNMDVVLAFDEDNDGHTDIYVGASEAGWLDDRKDALLRNTGSNPPSFADVTDAAGMYPTTDDGALWCPAGVDEFYCDRDAYAGGVLDWRGDGALDVFVTGNDPDFLQRGSDFLWQNARNVVADGSAASANDWIQVELRGANTRSSRVLSNRFGIGAKVTVIPRFNLPGGAVPTETQCLQYPLPAGVTGITKEVIAGNQSQSSVVLHFGLGNVLALEAKRVDCIKVAWPSGLERAYPGVTANTKVVLAEDVGRMKIIGVLPNNGPNALSNAVTVTGLHFDRDVSAVPQVLFGAVPAVSVTFVSDHELTAWSPLWQPAGVVNVTVINTDGQRDTLLAGYTFIGSSANLRFRDPVPNMITANGIVPNDPNFVASRGAERTGIIADGVTELVFESEVEGGGTVRFDLDDDDDAGNAPPAATSLGTIAGLGGGAPQTTITVPVTDLSDGRHVAHVVYTAPQDFIRSAADGNLMSRSIRVRTTYKDAAQVEHPFAVRPLELHRVPVLFVHGMWGNSETFDWPMLRDPRWIVGRADYRETSAVSFRDNAAVPPRVIAELRRSINARGIAGTRFFVFGHSMGAVLFKMFVAGAGAPYARADNFFAGDVYALVSVDAPFFGARLASFVGYLSSLPTIGPYFVAQMTALGWRVDEGCMSSLDPDGPDISAIPVATGTFHAMTGWGGAEMRAVGIELSDSRILSALRPLLEILNLAFDSFLLQCGGRDDFIVCVDSQAGGLSGAHAEAFHYVGASEKAIHFDSIARETIPGDAAEQLLNTPTTDASAWSLVLPAAPPVPLGESASAAPPERADVPGPMSGNDGFVLSVSKLGDSVGLTWTGSASRLIKSPTAGLASAACFGVTGTSFVDSHELTDSTSAYYEVGATSLCDPGGSLSIASVNPPSGSTMGGYAVTLEGAGFGTTPKVEVGNVFASPVAVANGTRITFQMIPGHPGPATVTVVDPAGRTASSTFLYTTAAEATGGVVITAPYEGAVVAAGSTILVSAAGHSGFKIARAVVSTLGVASDEDDDPGELFTTRLVMPADHLGPITIELLAKDANGNIKRAVPVHVTVAVPGSVALLRLDAEPATLLYASPSRQLHVHGVYSDGVRREVTRVPGILFEMDTQDIRKPDYPYNGTGVAVVDASGLVTAKTCGSTVCHITYEGRRVDVLIEVAELRPALSLQRPGFISWPYQGAGISYDVIRGKLSGLRASGGNFADPAVGTTCLKDNFSGVTAADATNPPVNEGFFYLMRESRTRSYDESPFWPTRSQAGRRTDAIGAAASSCP